MAGPTLGDRTRVKTTKVFFGNLSYFCSAQDVHELLLSFVPSSRIYSVDVCKTKAHDPLYYGFVHLLDAQTAAQVIETLNGRLFMGRQLRVHSGAKSPTAPAKDNSAGSSFQVLFSFVCGRSPHVLAEEQFRAIFLAHGRVKDCVIKSYYRHAQGVSDAPQPSSEHADHSGYGFVCVDELAAAHRLVAIFQRTTITVGLSFGGRPPAPVTLEIDCKLSYQTASIAEPPSAHLASPMSCASSATGSTGSAAPPAAFAELQLPPLGGSMAPLPAAPRLQPQQPVMVWMVPASQSPPSPAGPCNAPHGGWPMPPFYRAQPPPSPMMMPMMMASSPPLSSSPPAFFSFASPPLAPPSAPAPPAFFYYSPPASPSQQFDPRRPAASHM